MQIQVAQDHKLPLVVHCRNAWEDTFAILNNFPKLPNVVLHSYTGDALIAKTALNWGYMLSFSGIVTFKNAKDIQEAARICPDTNILVETDSPFLSPEPYRGQTNEPKRVWQTAEFLATLRDQKLDQFAQKTIENTNKVYQTKS